MSIVRCSIGSCSLPSISLVTTWGFPTVSSNPSRRIVSTNTASCNSPLPCTSHISGDDVGRTRIDTLPTASASKRPLTNLAVSLFPSLPASGDVFIPIVIESVGSSTAIAGNGRGSSGSERVSPIDIFPIPATAIISPGPASSISTRSRASVPYIPVSLTISTVPSRRHQATSWPCLRLPLCIRQIANLPI